MKTLFLSVFTLISLGVCSQNQKSFYGKISPGLVIAEDIDPTFAGFISGGAIIKNKFGVGLSFGYMKLAGYEDHFLPVGGEVIYCNFAAKKWSPIIGAGVYKLMYLNEISAPGYTFKQNGQMMFRLGGGAGYKYAPGRFLALSGYYAPFSIETETSLSGVRSNSTSNGNLFQISLELTL